MIDYEKPTGYALDLLLPQMPPELRAQIDQSQLVAFDYDGVIADTEPRQFEAFSELVADKTGIVRNFRDIAAIMIGWPERKIIAQLQVDHGFAGDMQQLLDERAQHYINVVKGSTLRPNDVVIGAAMYTRSLERSPIILSNGRSTVLGTLNDHWDISGHFDRMYAVDQRPDHLVDKRDFLLNYAKENNILVSSILVLEDSVSTIEKCEEAGIRAVYVQHGMSTRPGFVPKTGVVIKISAP